MKEIRLPEAFPQRAREFSGIDYASFLTSFHQDAPVSIRNNPHKHCGAFHSAESIPWSRDGRYLSTRPSFTLDPFFHAGCYYVQEASSQFLEFPFLQARAEMKHPVKVLDLCAAPGGKSTHLLSLMDEEDLLVSNEIIAGRNNVLRQNIMKWGRSNAVVTQNEPASFKKLEGYFDIVVVDAPCSGEGLFRRDNDAIGEWSVENVNRCSVRQSEILNSAFVALRPGGYLIYSTCTFETCENEGQVEKLVTGNIAKHISIEHGFPGVVNTDYGLRFYPDRIKGEGFFISLMQKEEGSEKSFRTVDLKHDDSLEKHLAAFLSEPEKFIPFKKDDMIYAIPVTHRKSYSMISQSLYVRHAGIPIGQLIGKDIVPSPALALSSAISDSIPFNNLEITEALNYLRGNACQAAGSKGFQLARFGNFNLGWMKNIGSRSNNYYPKEWRIKKS